MTKLLNLDDIALESKRTVVLDGVTYAVKDFDLEDFIAFQGHFRAFGEHYNSTDMADLVLLLADFLEIVKLGLPDLSLERAKKLNPLQMLAVVSMIANLIPDADEETQDAIEKKDQQEAPVKAE